jgi:ABC-type Fe3+ transport system substrate-binding protein
MAAGPWIVVVSKLGERELTMDVRITKPLKSALSRRATITTLAAVLLVPLALNAALADTSPKATSDDAQMAALYAKAKTEGGNLTVYMGGDMPGQWDAIGNAFMKTFPEIKVNIVVDLSKYHDARIDNQLANKNLVPDMAVLQTLQDFDRWKQNGVLLNYKPIGWNNIFANAKDADGYWTGAFYGAFAPMIQKSELTGDPSSFKATDLLAPKYKDKLIFTYPNDDDAVLFGFKLLTEKYGWDWLKGIAAQNPALVRGLPNSSAGVSSGKYLASLATAGDPGQNAVAILDNSDPFISWAQRAAIFKAAQHPETAKLFVSWLVSAPVQKMAIASWTWSVRKDVAPPAWLKPLASYKNTDTTAFGKFMSDRAGVEMFRSQLELYFRPVTGVDPASPSAALGLTPGV